MKKFNSRIGIDDVHVNTYAFYICADKRAKFIFRPDEQIYNVFCVILANASSYNHKGKFPIRLQCVIAGEAEWVSAMIYFGAMHDLSVY